MYSDQKISHRGLLLALVLLLLIAAALFVWLRRAAPRDLSEESALAIEAAIMRSAQQCYAVEGAYPPNLRYLEENYGLKINTEDYYVRYEAFASNLPPEILVRSKQGGGGA